MDFALLWLINIKKKQNGILPNFEMGKILLFICFESLLTLTSDPK